MFFWISKNYILFQEADNLTFFNTNVISYTYNSVESHCLLYSIPFLIFLGNYCMKINETTLLRGGSRNLIYKKRIKEILQMAIFFVAIHLLVNIAFYSITFGTEYLVSANFYQNITFSSIGFFFFYGILGLIYSILEDLTGKSVGALFISFLFIMILFFADSLVISNDRWTPINDLAYLQLIPVYGYDLLSLFGIYIRGLATLVSLYLIGSTIFVRKDVLDD